MSGICSIDVVIDELEDFIYWLSNKKHVEDTIMMDSDELVGELFLELVKGYQYYEDKNLSKSEFLAVLRRMMDNRISELMYKYFVTHRKNGVNYVPIDALIDRSDSEGFDDSFNAAFDGIVIKTSVVVQAHMTVSIDPEAIVMSRERVDATLTQLTLPARNVLEAIINGNELLQMNLHLVGDRAAYVFKNGGTVNVKPWHVADSLGMDIGAVKQAFREITRVYAEVCDG